jgi:cyclic pyranopterin phosphate synthase
LSVTDRCDLRCRYCMPAEGLPVVPSSQRLTAAELVRLARIAVGLGVESVRITGGEPLLRNDVVDVVRALARLEPRPTLALTTNGMRLAALAEPLRAAGLDRVNVSLDTLRPETFRVMARRDGLGRVLSGLDAAARAGLEPVKVNTVLLRGVNDEEAPELLEFCLERGYEWRFIEQMPLDAGRTWRRQELVTADEVLSRLAGRHRLRAIPGRGSAPAEAYEVDGGPGRVGIVAAVTRPFCGSCDRIRITADGQLRNCLFARTETDLRAMVRAGASDEALAETMADSVRDKAAGHGIDDPSFVQPGRSMSAIGG